MLCLRRPGGGTIGLLANYALHYIGIPEDRHAISADYFGYFSTMIQRLRDESFVAALANGACADVNNIDVIGANSPQAKGRKKAPDGVSDPMDSRAKKFGTLPAIASMQTPSGDVMLDQNAAAALAMFTQNIQAPFTIIAATMPKVSHAPTGRIDMTISGTLAASL